VYVGEDVRLRRLVAIKVLHPALAGDAAFLRRFQAEARVVAALRHPNILRVYDWGQDEDAPYLVMELLAGGSLRALLDRGELLSPVQAAAVGADAARALDYAHRRGLVHRDVKPANLIFDEEGRLTVADFGLARALAEATWTEPAGAVVGTARYAAPEQVRGESLDSRADVYALSLVLIEATTGVVPFAADTTLATLMARIDRPVRVPADLGPLGPVLEAAGTIDPADRLDAMALARALDGVVARLPPPAPLPLAGPATYRELDLDDSPTDYPGRPRLYDGALDDAGVGLPASAPPADAATPAGLQGGDGEGTGAGAAAPGLQGGDGPGTGPGAGAAAAPGLQGGDGPGTGPVWAGPGAGAATGLLDPGDNRSPTAPLASAGDDAGGATATGGAIATGGASGPGAEPSGVAPGRPRRRRWRWVVAGLAGLVIVVAAVAAVLHFTGTLTPSHPVPGLVGATRTSALERLRPLHLRLQVTGSAYDARASAGTVINQHPTAGRLKEGGTIAVTLSRGPRPVAVPNVQGLTTADAAALLKRVGLKATETRHPSMTVPAGAVISSKPNHGSLLPGQTVALVVSTGKPTVPVPGVAGASLAAARASLVAAGLRITELDQYHDEVPKGAVIGTLPAAGAPATVGSPVTVIVSLGPHLVAVPDVAGDSVGAASQALAAAGFQISGVTGNPIATVTSTSPGAGTLAYYGSPVQIVTN
jgi:serine/threonine-protein kinase